LFTSKLPFIRTPKHEDQQAVVQALIMAQEETLLAFLLVLAGIAMWNFQGGEDPEARLWAVLMWAQSVPYWASFALSLISTAPKPPSKKTAATAPSLPSATPADQGSPAQ